MLNRIRLWVILFLLSAFGLAGMVAVVRADTTPTPIYVVITDPPPSPIFLIVTATPTPVIKFIVVTATPTIQYKIVTNTPIVPTPANSATAISASATARIANFEDHFVLGRPFTPDLMTVWARNYAYGSSDNGALRVHHGIDISNPLGSSVLATAGGTVYYAGMDIEKVFGPQPNFYGNTVVIEHPFKDYNGQTVYTLYGHLSKVLVAPGQTVAAGDPIGIIGATGIAAGTHLHVEVRVGNPDDYLSTRNPELWIAPFQFRGVIAGRVVDEQGQPVMGVRVEVASQAENSFAYTYNNDQVNGDSYLKENFVIPDLAEGEYRVSVKDPDRNLFGAGKVMLRAGRTTWIELRVKPR